MSDIRVGEIVAHRIWWVSNHVDEGEWDRLLLRYVCKERRRESGIIPAPALQWKLHSAWFSSVEWFPHEVMVAKNVFQLSESETIFGIHAFKNRLDCFRYLKRFTQGDIYAVGTVYLWGDVRIYQRGYLASHAAVKSIDAVVNLSKTWDYEKERWRKIKIFRKPEVRNQLRQTYCDENIPC